MNNKIIKFPEYFITKENIICHTISELSMMGDKVIGLPKYFPFNGDKISNNFKFINGIKYYNHLESFYHSIERIRQYFPKYLKFVPFFGEELCIFDYDKDITKIYNPIKTAKTIYENNYKEQIYKDAKLLITYLVQEMGISIDDIGIEGSIMTGGFKEESDIDMIVLGKKSIDNLKTHFKILGEKKEVHLYDMADIPLIYSRRSKYKSFDNNEELLKQEKRRTVGLINGRRFWIQPILGNNKIEYDLRERHLVNIDIIEDEFKIIDSSYSYLWPSFYEIHNLKYGTIKLECYDPIYMNQCCVGDTVLIRGKLYKDLYSSKYVIILGPWIFTQQYLRNTLFIK